MYQLMAKILIIFFLQALFFKSLFGQAAIDSTDFKIRTIVSEVIPAINKLSDSSKAMLLYKWVSENMKYDHALANSSKLVSFNHEWDFETRNLDTILRRKMAVCNGISLLYFKLCQMAGLRVEEVQGEVKGFELGASFVFYLTTDHSWNMVFWNGQWHPIDCTWALSKGGNATIDWLWFDTNPDIFFLTHFADNQEYNLRYEKVSKQQFRMLPYLSQNYFEQFRLSSSIVRDFLAGKTSVLSFFKYPKVGVTTYITKMSDCGAPKVNTVKKKLLNDEVKLKVINDKSGCYTITTVEKENITEGDFEIESIRTTDDVARFNFKKGKL